MTSFEPAVVAAVTRHMNDDHADDNLLVVRAFAEPTADVARMTGVHTEFGEWVAEVGGTETTVRVPWLEPVADRAGIRTAVVALYHAACERLGVPPRQH
ncbi:hypothetical protein D092_07340 [Rhodococcus ruber Chol-4]|uniref:DUF2470 domain-containing protein n=1 Tax=Rhodococcus TaxID=1827 RepID=UPI00029A2734|nr:MULTISPECIES: DUF2470 domain-containing protein [Rhodococcus]MDO2379610.1 DUF2470 domain-containing protein [Rhodococcus ruber]RIK12385.1 MAG: DUF2470 domain-containing protein [Acidobacteriota bacterium]ATQ28088.1 DUF2470 domain-containing protein [Rhodococcus ruber]AUM17037.1 DUF2470 domain-containing protein [Rhodococcus ruber]AWG99481.1 DUF2470 domain-containing protein [Rhodococcus ruber]